MPKKVIDTDDDDFMISSWLPEPDEPEAPTKLTLREFLETHRASSLEDVKELKESYDSLGHLHDDASLPENIVAELKRCALLISDPRTPQFPLPWKQFIPKLFDKDLISLSTNITEGDLIYGLYGDRIIFFDFLKEVDDRLRVFSARTGQFYHATVDPFISLLINSEDELASFKLPAYSFKEFAETIKTEIKSFVPSSIEEANRPFVKKMSKMGILWTLSKGNKIHFILNKIDYKFCFQKKFDKITFAELRFIYRFWEQLKPFYEQDKIVFYYFHEKQLKKVEAPWESKSSIIESYKPKYSNLEKYKSKFSLFSSNINQADTQKNPQEASPKLG